jgi:3-hydroxyacyl-CoA dehydrogenase
MHRCRRGCFARDGVHAAEGSYSASANTLQARSTLPVYQRQIFPERVLGEKAVEGVTTWENDGVRLWTLPQLDSEIASSASSRKSHARSRCDHRCAGSHPAR